MSQEQRTPTKEEIITGLTEAIEIQKLQTDLQKLRTELLQHKANEILYTIKINEMYAKENDSPDAKPSTQEQEFNSTKNSNEEKVPESKL